MYPAGGILCVELLSGALPLFVCDAGGEREGGEDGRGRMMALSETELFVCRVGRDENVWVVLRRREVQRQW